MSSSPLPAVPARTLSAGATSRLGAWAVELAGAVVALGPLQQCRVSGFWSISFLVGPAGAAREQLVPVSSCVLGHFRSRRLAASAAVALAARVALQLAQLAPRCTAAPPAAPVGGQLGLGL